MAAFCRRHHYSGRRPAAELVDRLRAAPVAVDQLDPEVLADSPIRIQVRLLRSLLAAFADLDRALAAALGKHPKATVLQVRASRSRPAISNHTTGAAICASLSMG